MTYREEIKERLIKGENLGNDISEWNTVNRLKDNCKCICIRGDYRFYRNWNTYTTAVVKLLNGVM